MVTINLKEYYPEHYSEDTYVEVSADVAEFMEAERRKAESLRRKTYRYQAQYSLDAEDGIEEETILQVFKEAEAHEKLHLKLEQAKQSLTEVQYRRMMMRFENRMTYADIARIEGVTVKAVEKSIRSGLTKLKNIFVNIV